MNETPKLYNREKHRSRALQWLHEILAYYKEDEAYKFIVELFDSSVTNLLVRKVQLHAAVCLFIVVKVRNDRGEHIWSDDLVELADGAFTKDDLMEHEYYTLNLLNKMKILHTLAFMIH